MEISPRKPSKRAQEPIDEWLQNGGYFRKHAPRDPTCLFRAVSEQVYMTQHYHIRVRKECVEFMRKMKHLFIEEIAVPFEDYLSQMTCFTEWGGLTEIQAMSLLYKRDFVIFNSQNQGNRIVTNNGFKDVIYLCHTPQKQYESVYTKDFVANAAFCQSIAYQLLYKNVFQMPNINTIVHKMLHDRSATFRHDKFFLKGNVEIREQLASEIYNEVDKDEPDNAQDVTNNMPPFPYRIAKALDPNIYRNTDFDIWHEIRREVKNAGWTRYNCNELQIGGKCLVEVNFTEGDFDKANNNDIYVSLEKDSNDDSKALQKKGKDPMFYYGHIQEMSKNQGPVLVFIEELGEKRIVPYSALKPLPPKKSKQNPWLPLYKKNVLLDSNQKWKKACNMTSRKTKDSGNANNVLSNNTDKNENSEHVPNKNSYKWKDGAMKVNNQAYQNYPLEKCPDYTPSNSVDTYPAGIIHDKAQSSAIDITKQESSKDRKGKGSFAHKNSENSLTRVSKSDNVMNDDNPVFDSYSKQGISEEVYYPPYGDAGSQMDYTLNSINCSVQKSIDINGSDLPLSDPFTLRFFYNLGLEYFRGGNNWNYPINGQPPNFGPWYQGIPLAEEEITNISNMVQDCSLTHQKREYDNNRKETSGQMMCQGNGDKSVNAARSIQNQKIESPKEEHENGTSYPSKAKEQEFGSKDSQHSNRNGLGPRFKKNSEDRHKTASRFSNQYPVNAANSKSSKFEKDAKGNNSTNTQISYSVSHQAHNPASTVNSYQSSYMQQGMYPGLPYYTNEAEAFANSYYPPGPGFFPFQCLPHPDIPNNNGMPPFSPHMCPGIDYSQAYSGLCAPYMCAPNPFNISPQNIPEHWYAFAGQPHPYMQYGPMFPLTGEYNGVEPANVSQNPSS